MDEICDGQDEVTGVCNKWKHNSYPRLHTTISTVSRGDPQPCIDFCMQANSEKVVGVTVKDDGLCYCHLTDASGVETTQYTHPYGKWFGLLNVESSLGTGNVAFANSYFSTERCFRNEVSACVMFESSSFRLLLKTYTTFSSCTLHDI